MEHEAQSVLAGARNAIAVCLNVGPTDRVWIITDQARDDIGRALEAAARERGATVQVRHMEEYGPRPLLDLPEAMEEDLRAFDPTVTLLATTAQPGELRFRLPFARFLRRELKVRHGHMIGVTKALMTSGMLADYQRVAALTLAVREQVRAASEVHVTSPAGTDLLVQLDNENYRWVVFPGLYHQPGEWGNLPEGELCTTPGSVSGVLVAHMLGDYFSRRYGVLEVPITFHIADGWLQRVEHPDEALAREVWEYLDQAPNGRRVGEFAIGTNEALSVLSGNLLQDEKIPGVHLAFGNPVPEVTGADWSSNIHVDAISIHCSIHLHNKDDAHITLMDEGRFCM